MNFIKRNIPNTITLGNLLCGCLAIVKAFEGDLVWAAYLVGIAAVLDFFDGFAARMLKVSSPIGKDLDSLADMVTFGVVPGVVMFQMINESIGLFGIHAPIIIHDMIGEEPVFNSDPVVNCLRYVAFLIPIFSAIRLAKFNNDTRQSDSFIGVPTPANAIFLCSLALIIARTKLGVNLELENYINSVSSDDPGGITYIDIERQHYITKLPFGLKVFSNHWGLIITTIIMSYLLVAELPLIALKFKNFKWKGNEIRFIFLIGSVILLASLQLVGIPLVIVFYILISVVNNIINRRKTSSR